MVLLYPQLMANICLFGIDKGVSILSGQIGIRRKISVVLKLSLILTVPAVALSIVFAYNQIIDTDIRHLSLLYVAYIPSFFIMMFSISLFLGAGNYKNYNLIRISYYIAYLLILILLLVFQKYKVKDFVIANLAAQNIAMVVAIILLREGNEKVISNKLKDNKSGIGRIFFLSLIFVVPCLMQNLAIRLEQIIVVKYLNNANIGIFVVYLAYSKLIAPITNAISVTVFQKGIEKKKYFVLRVVRSSLTIYAILLFGMSLLADPLIDIFYGEVYKMHMGALYLLITAAFFNFSAQVLNENMKAEKKIKQELVALTLYVLCIVFVISISLKRYGLYSVATAMLIGNIIRYLTIMALFIHRNKVGFIEMALVTREDLRYIVRKCKLHCVKVKNIFSVF